VLRDASAAIAARLERLSSGLPVPTRVGVDAVHIPTWERHLAIAGEPLLARLYTTGEREFSAGRVERLASRLAAKEATLKVLGTGVRGVALADVEVLSEPAGRPRIVLHGPASTRAAELGLARVEISLCHEAELALAVALGVEEGSL
jgi:holo-[acyl-carrier protein] synthase